MELPFTSYIGVCVILVGLSQVAFRYLFHFQILQGSLESSASPASFSYPSPARDINTEALEPLGLSNGKVETRKIEGKGYGLVAVTKIYGRTEVARFSANFPEEGFWVEHTNWAEYKRSCTQAELDWALRYAFAVRLDNQVDSPIVGHIVPSKTNLGCRSNEPDAKGKLREKANAFTKKLPELPYPVIALMAMRDILPGEEVTYDYGDHYKRDHY